MKGNVLKGWILAACVVLLILCLTSSILFGATNFNWRVGWDALFHYDASVRDQIIIRTTRLPRAFIAAVIGASLAVAGTIMQALTRNPLASPGVLGVNAGATFFVVMSATILSISSMQMLMWMSFLGAAISSAIVFSLGSLGREGLTPANIILAGSAITALFASFTQGMLAIDQQGLNSVLFWLTGSIAGRSPELLYTVLPYMVGCWLVACFLARDLNLLMMGGETAASLGQRILLVRVASGILIVVLAGGSVSVVGPIGFIGVVIPHLSRFFVGLDIRWVIPGSALLGAILLIIADLAARFIMMPEEMPVGVMLAVLGAPFFIYVARKGRGNS
jgi:iron complex transport system permease protein